MDYSGDNKLPASLSFSIRLGVWLAKILRYVPHACFVLALTLLGGMVFSPATGPARWSLLGFATAVFVRLLLFTFLNRKALYTSSTPFEPTTEGSTRIFIVKGPLCSSSKGFFVRCHIYAKSLISRLHGCYRFGTPIVMARWWKTEHGALIYTGLCNQLFHQLIAFIHRPRPT